LITDSLSAGKEPDVVSSARDSLPAYLQGAPIGVSASRPEFAEVYREHHDFVWRSARRERLLVNHADDVVQDVFVTVHRRLTDYDPAAPIRGWIYGIIRNVIASHKRRFRRKDAPLTGSEIDEAGEERFVSTAPSPAAQAEQSEAVVLLERLLSRLAPEKAEVLVLAHLEQMTVPEIAEGTGENINTIYSRLRTARRELDELLATERRAESGRQR
jgi:RNA polymerase sigma-70 factor (ECF subfamily)